MALVPTPDAALPTGQGLGGTQQTPAVSPAADNSAIGSGLGRPRTARPAANEAAIASTTAAAEAQDAP